MSSVQAPRSALARAWGFLVGGSMLALVLGATWQVLVLWLFDRQSGVCVPVDRCGPGQQPTTGARLVLLTLPTFLIWLVPPLATVRRAWRLRRRGVPGATPLLVAGAVLAGAVTLVALRWWLPS